jgi:hypothetical protein
VTVLAGVFLQAHFFLLSESHEVDSFSYWFAARATAEGLDPYDTRSLQAAARAYDLRIMPGDPQPPDVYPYVYPPPFAGVWRVFLLLTPVQTHHVLEALGTLLLGVALVLLPRVVRARRHAHLLWACFTLSLLVNGPAISSTRLGQINALLLVLTLIATGAQATQRVWRSAFTLGAAALLKITPAVVLVGWFIGSPREGVAQGLRMLAAMMAMALLSLTVAPPAMWPHFREALHVGIPWQTVYSWWGFLSIRAEHDATWASLKLPLMAVGVVVLFALAWCHLRRTRPERRALEGASVGIVLGLLAGPLTWQHHFLLFMLPAYAWISEAWDDERVLHTVLLAGLTVLVLLRLPGSLLAVRPLAVLAALAFVALRPRRLAGAALAQ